MHTTGMLSCDKIDAVVLVIGFFDKCTTLPILALLPTLYCNIFAVSYFYLQHIMLVEFFRNAQEWQ